MVTTTDTAGSTIIGTYELITIDQYKSLREQQTVTVSQTTTGSDQQPTVVAVAAVVAAGGVAWILGMCLPPSSSFVIRILISDI
jgi:hypothetical protein